MVEEDFQDFANKKGKGFLNRSFLAGISAIFWAFRTNFTHLIENYGLKFFFKKNGFRGG
jgi:hypothetical protein